MGGLFFLLTLGWAFGRCSRDAFFIKSAGPERLPYIYLMTAGAMALTSSGYSQIVDRMTRHRLFILQLLISSGCILIVWLMIPFDQHVTPYLLFGLSEVVSSLFFMHFWTYANAIFDVREGKRLFPLISAVGLLGTVLGSTLAPALVLQIGTVHLLIVWSASLSCSIPLVLRAHDAAQVSGSVELAWVSENEQEQMGFARTVVDLWRTPLVRTLTYLAIPMWLVSYFVDFQFFLAMDRVFVEQDQLAGFLGIFNSITFLSGFLLEIFVVGRVLRRFGIGTALLVHPFGLTFSALLLGVQSLMPWQSRAVTGGFAKYSDNALYYSIGDTASQLLYNAFPEERRGRCRAFISGTVEPICIALAGATLILLGLASIPLAVVTWMTVGLGFLWIYFARKVRLNYLRALVERLGSRDLTLANVGSMALSQMSDEQTSEVLLEAITSADEKVAHFALDLLREGTDETILNKLGERLLKVRPPIQLEVLRMFSEGGTADVLPAIYPLLSHPEPDIRAASVRAVGRLGEQQAHRELAPFLDDTAPSVCAEALIVQIRHGGEADSVGHIMDRLKAMANDPDPSVQAHIAYVIGEVRIRTLLPLLLEFAAAGDPWLQSEAVHALGKIGDEQAIPPLMQLLDVDRLVPKVIAAIVALGETVLEQIHRDLLDGDTRDDIKIHLIECVKQLCSAASVPMLLGLLLSSSHQIGLAVTDALVKIIHAVEGDAISVLEGHREIIATFLAEVVQRLQREQAMSCVLQHVDNTKHVGLVMDALQCSLRWNEEAALQCLQLLTDPKTIRAAAVNLHHPESRARAEAIEAIEASCDEARDLVWMLETKYGQTEGITVVHPSGELNEFSETGSVIQELLRGAANAWLQTCAAHAAGTLKLAICLPELLDLQRTEDDFLRSNVRLALQRIGIESFTGEEEQMAARMERILFLRSVPLFAEVEGSDLRWIDEITREEEYSAGQIIFRQYDEGDALYIIVSGSVRVIKEKGGRQVVLAIMQEGECFGEMAILNSEPRSASIEVQKDVRLLVIDQDDFQRLLLARPRIASGLLRTLSQRLREVVDQLVGKLVAEGEPD